MPDVSVSFSLHSKSTIDIDVIVSDTGNCSVACIMVQIQHVDAR